VSDDTSGERRVDTSPSSFPAPKDSESDGADTAPFGSFLRTLGLTMMWIGVFLLVGSLFFPTTVTIPGGLERDLLGAYGRAADQEVVNLGRLSSAWFIRLTGFVLFLGGLRLWIHGDQKRDRAAA
jgi:hypothetical protein